MPIFEQRTRLPLEPERVFDWHDRPGAFQRLTPPWEDVRLVEQEGGLAEGARIELDMPFMGPLRTTWRGRHTFCERPTGFTDVAVQSPFAAWTHEHRFLAVGDGTEMVDRVTWRAPLGVLGRLAQPWIQARLNSMFCWRHQRVCRDLRRHDERGAAPMRIAMTGSTGLVGQALTHFLRTGGHTVVPLVRKRGQEGIFWDPLGGEVGPGLESCDAVVHLAGAPIAEHRWTEEYKRTIRESRVRGTETLCRALAELPPKTLVSTSAIGLYGDRGDEELTEHSEAGQGFLADVGRGWEAAQEPAEAAGWRVATVRVGLVISARGGLLGPLLPMFRTGMGGPVAGGQHWMSWIHLDDLVGLYHWLLTGGQRGVYNGVAPNPVRNRDFTRSLGRAVRRPAIVPAPAFAVRGVLGREKADELVLASQRVLPARALEEGFRFDCPSLDEALAFELGRVSPDAG